jgi:hypothetical protein
VAAPSTFQALSMGARAAGRSAWLVAPALLVSFLRTALTWPAFLFAAAMLRAGAEARLASGLAAPVRVLSGAVAALTAPRSLAILLGLWLAGALAAAALRVAWLAGAIPTLGEDLSRAAAPRARFAEGLAYGFAPLLGTAILALAVELGAQLYAVTVSLGAVTLLVRGGGAHPGLAAVLGAIALTSAVAAPVVAGLVGDAALARTALRGDRAARALAEGAVRVLSRPGAFLLSALALGVAALVVVGSAQAVETAALGVASGAPPLLAVGPRLMASTVGAGIAALLELWRLGTVAALACSEPGG